MAPCPAKSQLAPSHPASARNNSTARSAISPRRSGPHPSSRETRTCARTATRSRSRRGTTTSPRRSLTPTTVEEIQEIVRIANRYGVPLWTIGQGRNNGYGGPGPARLGLGDREPARDEQGARDRRGVRLRGRRAGRALVRPLRGDQGGRPQADAVDRRRRLGERRSATRSTTASPTCPTAIDMGAAVRHGGRAAQRRADAHRHGRDAAATARGTSTSAASARRPTSCSCSRTSGS